MSAGEAAQNPVAGPASRGARALAWSIHAFTASGAAWGLLALQAAEDRDWAATVRWLFVALVVDALDGPMARACKITKVLPGFDGNILDLVVDYLTYVIVPAVVLYRGDFLPEAWRTAAAMAVLVSALYHYGNVNIKTRDGYFEGFPAFWNIVVFYLFCFNTGPWLSAAVVFGLCGLTLVPVKCVHPFRVKKFRAITAPVTIAWAAIVGVVLAWPGNAAPSWLLWVSLGPAIYLTAISLRRTFGGPDVVENEK